MNKLMEKFNECERAKSRELVVPALDNLMEM